MLDKITKLIQQKFGKPENDNEVTEFKQDLAQIVNKPILALQRKCDGVIDNVALDSILFFKKYDEKDSVVRTYSHIYNNPYIFAELANILENTEFEHFDRSLFVNPAHIKKYDSFMFRIYFDEHADKDSISVDITHRRLAYLKKLVGAANDVSTESLYVPKRRQQHNN